MTTRRRGYVEIQQAQHGPDEASKLINVDPEYNKPCGLYRGNTREKGTLPTNFSVAAINPKFKEMPRLLDYGQLCSSCRRFFVARVGMMEAQ